MTPFSIARPGNIALPEHLAQPLSAVRVATVEEIPLALAEVLRFFWCQSVIVPIGSLPQKRKRGYKASMEVIISVCAEVLPWLGKKHSVVTVTNGCADGLAGLLDLTREETSFPLLGVKRAEPGDASGVGIALNHSCLLTIEQMPEVESVARLRAAADLAQKMGLTRRSAIALLMGGDATTWNDLRCVVQARIPLVVVGGTGGIADALADVQAYRYEQARASSLTAKTRKKAIDREALDWYAAGFWTLYQREVSVYKEFDSRFPLWLKGELRIL